MNLHKSVYLPILKNGLEVLKLVSKMGFNYNKWNKNFRLKHSVRKNGDYLFRCSVATGNFILERPEKPFSFTFQEDFQKTLGTW